MLHQIQSSKAAGHHTRARKAVSENQHRYRVVRGASGRLPKQQTEGQTEQGKEEAILKRQHT